MRRAQVLGLRWRTGIAPPERRADRILRAPTGGARCTFRIIDNGSSRCDLTVRALFEAYVGHDPAHTTRPCAQDLFLDPTTQGAHRSLSLAGSRLTGKARFAPHRGRFRPRPCDQGSRPSSIADRAPPQADTSHSACNTRELPAIFFINRRIDLVTAD